MNQIDNLMAKYADHVFSDGLLGLKVPSAQSEACLNELRQALQAALKPGGEPHHWIVPEFGFLFSSEDTAQQYLANIGSQSKPIACYTATPPAQTSPSNAQCGKVWSE